MHPRSNKFYQFFLVLQISSISLFFKHLSIQLFQKKYLPFNGKSAFHHKDKTQCAQLILPSRSTFLS